jgi:hypothetical protein
MREFSTSSTVIGVPGRPALPGRPGDHARVLRRPFALHDRDHRQIARAFTSSFPRKREPRGPEPRHSLLGPAFAGATGNIM